MTVNALIRRPVQHACRRPAIPTGSPCSRRTGSPPTTAAGRCTPRLSEWSRSYESRQPRETAAGRRSARRAHPVARPAALDPLARRAFRADFVAAYFVALTVWSVWAKADAGGPRRRSRAQRRWARRGGARPRSRGLELSLRPHDALCRDLAQARVQGRHRAADLHQHPVQGHRVRRPPASSPTVRARSRSCSRRAARVGYFFLWPSARPGRLLRPQPCLRCVGDAAAVSATLGAALREAAGQPLTAAPPRETKPSQTADGLTLAGRAA